MKLPHSRPGARRAATLGPGLRPPRQRHGLPRVTWLLAAGCLLGASLPVAGRTPADVQRAQVRFEASVAGYRQALQRLPGISAEEREVLGSVKFVFERSALPRVRSQWRFGERRILVSDGWMELVEELALAQAVEEALDKPGCFAGYARYALYVSRQNLAQADQGRQGQWVLRGFKDYLQQPEPACFGLTAAALRRPAVEEAAEVIVDAGLLWLITSQFALQWSTPEARSTDPAAAPARAGDTGCRQVWADRQASERTARLQRDLLPAHSAVLAHALLDGDRPGGGGGTCPDARTRVKAFLETQGVACGNSASAASMSRVCSRVQAGPADGY